MPRTPIVLASLTGCALLAPALNAQTPPSSDTAAVRRVIEAVAAYSQAKNFNAMDTLYAPGGGVHIIEGVGVNHGWEDFRDNHLKPEFAEFQNIAYRYYAIEPVIRGDVAWASFRYDFAVDAPSGHVESEGRGTAMLEKREGRWVIVHQHTSGRRKPQSR